MKASPRESSSFTLDGERLKGGFSLVRMRGPESGKRENWL